MIYALYTLGIQLILMLLQLNPYEIFPFALNSMGYYIENKNIYLISIELIIYIFVELMMILLIVTKRDIKI